MRIKYIGETDVSLTNGKEYEVISVESGWFRVVDETGEDYLFPPELFTVIAQ